MEKNETSPTKNEPNYRGVKAMPYVIGNEIFEKLGTIGTSSNLILYLTSVFHMDSITATNIVNIFNGTCNFGTLLGAFLCDSCLGRYKTLGIASVSSFLGMLVLTLTAAFRGLHPPECEATNVRCVEGSPWQLAFLFIAFLFLVIGASGIRPCNLAFGADQFNPKTDSGRRGSPFTGIFQMLVAAFRKRKLSLPEEPWCSLFNYVDPGSTNAKLQYTDELRFLNRAAIVTSDDKINVDGSTADPWRLRSVQQIEEVKCVIRVIPIWLSVIAYFIVLSLLQTYIVFQSLQSDRRLSSAGNFKIPAASYNVFTMLSLTIWIPIYDRLVVPFLRRITGREDGITVLQRIGVGMLINVFAMVVSGLIEDRRRTLAVSRPTLGIVPRKGDISSMSGYWLVPQLVLAGLSEGFVMVGENELFYKQFPENMRSFAAAFLFCGLALSSYVTSFLISIVHKVTRVGENENWLAEDLNKGRLDYFYYLIAGIQVVNLVYFLVCAKWYKYKSVETSDKDVAMGKIDHKKHVV